MLATNTRVSTVGTVIQGKMLRPGLARLPLSIDARVTAASAHIGGCQPPEAGIELWPGSRVSHTLPPLMPALSLPASLVSSSPVSQRSHCDQHLTRVSLWLTVSCVHQLTPVLLQNCPDGARYCCYWHIGVVQSPRPPDTIVAVSAQFPPCPRPGPAAWHQTQPSPSRLGIASLTTPSVVTRSPGAEHITTCQYIQSDQSELGEISDHYHQFRVTSDPVVIRSVRIWSRYWLEVKRCWGQQSSLR